VLNEKSQGIAVDMWEWSGNCFLVFDEKLNYLCNYLGETTSVLTLSLTLISKNYLNSNLKQSNDFLLSVLIGRDYLVEKLQ